MCGCLHYTAALGDASWISTEFLASNKFTSVPDNAKQTDRVQFPVGKQTPTSRMGFSYTAGAKTKTQVSCVSVGQDTSVMCLGHDSTVGRTCRATTNSHSVI